MSQPLNIFVGILLWLLLIIPIQYPLFFCCFVWKQITYFIVRFKRPNLFQLNFIDTLMASHGQPNSMNCVVSGVLRIDGNIDLKGLRSHFSKTFIDIPIPYEVFFRRIVSYAGFVYVEKLDEIDVKFHVREVQLEKDKSLWDFDTIFGEISRDNDHLSKGSVPQWEMVLVNSYFGAKCMVVLKVHHGLADGYSLVHLLDTLTGNASPYFVQDTQPSWSQMLSLNLKAPTNYLIVMYRWISANFPHNQEPRGGGDFASEQEKERHSKILVSTTTMDFRIVKKIRDNTGSQIMPILMTALTQGFKNSVDSLGQELDFERGESHFCRASYMKPLANHPVVLESKICNHFMMTLDRAIWSGYNRLEQLQKNQKLFSNSSDVENNDKAMLLSYWYSQLLPYKVYSSFCEMINRYTGIIFLLSTLILSSKPYQLLGLPVTNVYFSTFTNIFDGILLSTFTRGNEMDLSVSASNNVFKDQRDLDYFVRYIVPLEIKNLSRLAENRHAKQKVDIRRKEEYHGL